MSTRLTRREMLRNALVAGAGLALTACQPKVVEVEKIVKETVEVEKQVEVEKLVKETVVVEKQVEAASHQTTVRYHCRAANVLPPGSEFATHQNRLAEFLEEHPEINVVREDIATNTLADFYVKLNTMIAGGTVGDMTWDHQSDCDHQRLAFEGVLAPLDDFMERDAVSEDEWWPNGIVNAKFEGKLYGLPMCTHPGGAAFLFFNQDMFEEAGLKIPNNDDYTIDDLMEAARTLSTGDPSAREVYGFRPNVNGSQAHEGWMRAYGAYSFVDEEGKANLMDTEAGLTWAQIGYDQHVTSAVSPVDLALPASDMYAMFAGGKLAAFQSGTWAIKPSLAAVGANFTEGIVQFPKGPARRGTGNYLDTFAMLTEADDKDATWLLLRAFTDKRCGYLQISLTGALPGRGDFMEFDDLASDPIVQLEHKAISESEPQFSLYNFRGAEHNATMNNMLGAIWVNSEEPTQEYLTQVQQACQQILDMPR